MFAPRTDVGSNNGHARRARSRLRLLVWTRSYLFFCLFFVFHFLNASDEWRWCGSRLRAYTTLVCHLAYRVAELSAASNKIETIWYTFCAINALRRSNDGKKGIRARERSKNRFVARHFSEKNGVRAWTCSLAEGIWIMSKIKTLQINASAIIITMMPERTCWNRKFHGSHVMAEGDANRRKCE